MDEAEAVARAPVELAVAADEEARRRRESIGLRDDVVRENDGGVDGDVKTVDELVD